MGQPEIAPAPSHPDFERFFGLEKKSEDGRSVAAETRFWEKLGMKVLPWYTFRVKCAILFHIVILTVLLTLSLLYWNVGEPINPLQPIALAALDLVYIVIRLFAWKRLPTFLQDNKGSGLFVPGSIGISLVLLFLFSWPDYRAKMTLRGLNELGIDWIKTASTARLINKDIATIPAEVVSTLSELHSRIVEIIEHGNLQVLPDLSPIRSIEELNLSGCTNLRNIDGVQGLRKIKKLTLLHCTNLGDLGGVQLLTNLDSVFLGSSHKLQNLNGIAGCYSLKTITITSCSGLEDIRALEGMTNLTNVEIGDCPDLVDLDGLTDLPQLRTLHLKRMPTRSLEGLRGLPKLEEFWMVSYDNIDDVVGLMRLGNLRRVEIEQCPRLQTLDALKGLAYLEELRIMNCESINDPECFQRLYSLRLLWLTRCHSLQSSVVLKDLEHLEDLSLKGCDRLESVAELRQIPNLAALVLDDCISVRDINTLTGHENLQTLSLKGWGDNVAKLGALTRLRKLRKLELDRCSNVTNTTLIARLTNVTELSLASCTNLSDVNVLLQFGAIAQLDLSNCPRVALNDVIALKRRFGADKVRRRY